MDKSKPFSRERGQKFLDSSASLEDLTQQMPQKLREEWAGFGHLRVEPTFQDRVFCLFRASGRDAADVMLAPTVITTVRVLSFMAKDETGCVIRLLDESTNKVLEVTHVPVKLFDYPVFVAVPPLFTLRWDAREHGGSVRRSLSYLIFIKTRNKVDFYNKGNYYLETPNRMRALFPQLDLKLGL